MAYGTVNVDAMTTSDGVTSAGTYGFKNRIINGAMVIDQRNAGVSVTPTTSTYTLDRWNAQCNVSSKYSVQQTSTAPSGFVNSLKVTSLSAYSVGSGEFFMLTQNIEGYNTADLAWGSANAKTVTLSFQVYSSLTGTFGGAINNSDNSRSYPFTYTISSANTWTTISVTIAGDTSGTWQTTNSAGVVVRFGLGVGSTLSGTAGSWSGSGYFSATGATSVVGTNGATFYVTGVQLEKGSTATSFDYRPYGTELALSQRYFCLVGSQDGSNGYAVMAQGFFASSTTCSTRFKLPVTMRTQPSTSANGTLSLKDSTNSRTVGTFNIYSFSSDGCEGDITTASATVGNIGTLRGDAAGPANKPYYTFSAEL